MADKKPDKTLAIVGLILNIVILPGLGTIIAGRTKTGVIQLVLYIIGIPLIFAFGLGLVLMVAMWIWALVTGIQILQQAS
ncbi:MAG: hypothetical protein Q7J54_03395 [Candidatus Woesearchaeota archaeon]|nr:hypothetical protein [Candidatus Woesearchaeota archaeon]